MRQKSGILVLRDSQTKESQFFFSLYDSENTFTIYYFSWHKSNLNMLDILQNLALPLNTPTHRNLKMQYAQHWTCFS